MFLSLLLFNGTVVGLVLATDVASNILVALGLFLLQVMSPFVLLHWLFRCPTCNAGLGRLVAHFGPLGRFGRQLGCCPCCNVELDHDVVP